MVCSQINATLVIYPAGTCKAQPLIGSCSLHARTHPSHPHQHQPEGAIPSLAHTKETRNQGLPVSGVTPLDQVKGLQWVGPASNRVTDLWFRTSSQTQQLPGCRHTSSPSTHTNIQQADPPLHAHAALRRDTTTGFQCVAASCTDVTCRTHKAACQAQFDGMTKPTTQPQNGDKALGTCSQGSPTQTIHQGPTTYCRRIAALYNIVLRKPKP